MGAKVWGSRGSSSPGEVRNYGAKPSRPFGLRPVSSGGTRRNPVCGPVSSGKICRNPEIRPVSSKQHAQIENYGLFLPSNTPKSRITACFFPGQPHQIKTTSPIDLRRGTVIKTTSPRDLRRGTEIKNTCPRDLRRGTEIKNTSPRDLRRGTEIKNTSPGDLRRGTEISQTRGFDLMRLPCVSSEKHAQIENYSLFLLSNTPKSRILPCFFRETRPNREFRPVSSKQHA